MADHLDASKGSRHATKACDKCALLCVWAMVKQAWMYWPHASRVRSQRIAADAPDIFCSRASKRSHTDVSQWSLIAPICYSVRLAMSISGIVAGKPKNHYGSTSANETIYAATGNSSCKIIDRREDATMRSRLPWRQRQVSSHNAFPSPERDEDLLKWYNSNALKATKPSLAYSADSTTYVPVQCRSVMLSERISRMRKLKPASRACRKQALSSSGMSTFVQVYSSTTTRSVGHVEALRERRSVFFLSTAWLQIQTVFGIVITDHAISTDHPLVTCQSTAQISPTGVASGSCYSDTR
ncbi:hypothetical protein DOTSEDRAFT_39711 [Dothistroma septosporum NZE10]|uniref:Uncharacterized protein n=1 Tax=Dothistroma septosporum (strain NZE10 / CBS 128990) TaxID=675120 RepID=M2YI30_DOTSN|nr:hypothetical protein DOTSEDRAFT_39711 [Dothistroma septosporum NZE10]